MIFPRWGIGGFFEGFDGRKAEVRSNEEAGQV